MAEMIPTNESTVALELPTNENAALCLELLAPAGLVETELLQLLVGEGDHVVDDLLVLLVVGDGDGGPGDGAKLAALVAQLEQLHLEELLSAGGAHVVDDGDLDVLRGLPGLEEDRPLSSNEILPVKGRLVDSPVLHLDITVGSVLSVDRQDSVTTTLLGTDTLLGSRSLYTL